MADKKPQQIRKKLYEEYENSLFKLVIHEAAEKEGRLFLAEKEELKNDPEFLPSQEAVQQFSKQLGTHLKEQQGYARRQRILNTLNKTAAAVLIMLVILGVTVVTVQAVRVKVLNFLMDIQQEYTSFQLKDSNSDLEGGSTTIDWRQAYAPTYMPDGYEVYAATKNERSNIIEFQNPQGASITYMELSQGSKPHLDTENALLFKTVSINGHRGTMVEKYSLVTVIWAMNDRMFMIRGQTDKGTVVKIAEGVKYID